MLAAAVRPAWPGGVLQSIARQKILTIHTLAGHHNHSAVFTVPIGIDVDVKTYVWTGIAAQNVPSRITKNGGVEQMVGLLRVPDTQGRRCRTTSRNYCVDFLKGFFLCVDHHESA